MVKVPPDIVGQDIETWLHCPALPLDCNGSQFLITRKARRFTITRTPKIIPGTKTARNQPVSQASTAKKITSPPTKKAKLEPAKGQGTLTNWLRPPPIPEAKAYISEPDDDLDDIYGVSEDEKKRQRVRRKRKAEHVEAGPDPEPTAADSLSVEPRPHTAADRGSHDDGHYNNPEDDNDPTYIDDKAQDYDSEDLEEIDDLEDLDDPEAEESEISLETPNTPETPITDSEHVNRFQKIIKQMTALLQSYASGERGMIPWEIEPNTVYSISGPLNAGISRWLARQDLEELVETILLYIPRPTQSILGDPLLTPEKLFKLPYWDMSRFNRDWGCYLNLAVPRPTSGSLPAGDTKATEMGVYVGTSSSKKGIRERILQHKRIIRQARQRETTFRRKSHYELASRPSTISHFKQVARFPNGNKYFGTESHFIEGLMMVLLNLVNDPTPAEEEPDNIIFYEWHNPKTAAFIQTLRREVAESCGDLSDFKSSALNNAWRLSQGFDSSLKTRTTWGKVKG
ncbi:hypothetical protein QBC37DRAFT_481778 [Rhypophila decipiens]|uniref:Uncharacterized protein n=1 Tax=Rhypophila decipiens TaxID=261697 RepID=A0AAN7BBP6_9PEZI|nr:hypothetical protein QBC37DRAFT_481778 [Rhypophila decipiens]